MGVGGVAGAARGGGVGLPRPTGRCQVVSRLNESFDFQLRAAGIEFEREYKFHPKRKWKYDFSIVGCRLLIDCDGGQWKQGTGHNTGTGRERDCTKDAEAVLLGWTVLRFPTNMIDDGRALDYVEKFIEKVEYSKVNQPPDYER